MRKLLFPAILIAVCLFITTNIWAQSSTTVAGSVKNAKSGEVVSAVSVTIKGGTAGTFTDDKGNFKFKTTQKPPFTLVFSSVGFGNKEVSYSGFGDVTVSMDAAYTIGQEVTVSASRISERVLESPVSIERINLATIRTSPAATYYDMLTNLKGVDVVNASLTFKSVGTRGFNSSGNLRLNQLVDGMDNQAPGLNFSVGSIVGLTELDVESMELLPGASSALYGSGGMNGTVLINSKDPFKYQGLSWQTKFGMNHIDSKQRTAPQPYYDWSVRYASKISDKIAFKVGVQMLQASDWVSEDKTNYLRASSGIYPLGTQIGGTRTTDPNYDGMNTYGDETSVDIRPFIQAAIAGSANPTAANLILGQFLKSPYNVSRTGYTEKDVIDPTTINVKLTGSLHYKITNSITASFSAYWGTGNSVYTGTDRYSLKGLKLGQYKFELRHKDWFLRGFTTQENSGESFAATISTRRFNEAWKPSYNPSNAAGSWYPQYTGAFAQGAAQVFTQAMTATGGNVAASQAIVANAAGALNNAARTYADIGRPTGFIGNNPTFLDIVSKPIKARSGGGGLFLDRSSLYSVEGQYNLTNVLSLAASKIELIVGGSYKQYVLDSKGTLFADTAGKIYINEVGAYGQVSKKFYKDMFKLTASARYDKNTNFEDKVTPRFSLVATPVKNHNIRVSYQQAYRFPSTQNQWINLEVTNGQILMGGLPQLRNYYKFNTNPVYTPDNVTAFGTAFLTALAAQQGGIPNPSTATPIQLGTAYVQSAPVLSPYRFGDFKPETMSSYEIGYKGLINNKILIDAYYYWGTYKDFIGSVTLVQSNTPTSPLPALGLLNAATRTGYSTSVNLTQDVKTNGWGASIEYMLPRNFSVTANIYSDLIGDLPVGFVSYFNTPKKRINIGVSNSGFLYKNRVGFGVIVRTQDSFYYEGTFAVGTLPSYTTVDATLSYKFPQIKSLFKIGANNLYNKYYATGVGSPQVGGLYYVSFGYNVL